MRYIVGVSILLVRETKMSGEKPPIFRKTPINSITVTGWNQSQTFSDTDCIFKYMQIQEL